MKQDNSDYKKKQIIQEVEGPNSTGEVCDWIDEFCAKERIERNIHVDGCPSSALYEYFIRDNDHLKILWNEMRFLDAMFKYLYLTTDIRIRGGYCYVWNASKTLDGATRSARRMRKGKRGNQVDWVVISSEGDEHGTTIAEQLKNEKRVEKDKEFDADAYFEKNMK